MMESLISLSQMTRTTLAINELKNNRLPFINVFCNPTAGGTTASISSLSDIAISEKGATIAFSGKRVIQATIKEPLPEDFQTAEWAQRHGFCDIILERKDIPKTLHSLLTILMKIDTKVKSEKSNETSELSIETREHHKKKIDLSLDRTYSLLKKLGNPQDKLKNVINVVGTNSKASMAYSLKSILNESGYKCNLYTSPHLQSYTERFIFNDQEISEDNLIELLNGEKHDEATYLTVPL